MKLFTVKIEDFFNKYQKYFFLIFIFFVVLSVTIPINQRFQETLRRDSGVFMYTGWRLTEGDIPYKDVWDHKPPVIFIINAFGIWLSEILDKDFRNGIWLIELFFLIASSFILWLILEKQYSEFVAFLSIIIFLVSWPIPLSGGNLTTEYTILFQFLTVLFYRYWLQKENPIFYLFIGIFTSICFFTKQTTIAFGLITFFALLIQWRDDQKNQTIRSAFYFFFVGNFIVFSVVIIFFQINNAIYHFIDQAFLYNFIYINSSLSQKITAIKYGFKLLSNTSVPYFAVLGLFTFIKKSDNKQEKLFKFFLAGTLLLELIFC